MGEKLYSFIEDNKDMLDEIGVDGKDLSKTVFYTKTIIEEIKIITSNNKDENIIDVIFTNEFINKIKKVIKKINIPLKYKFILITTNIENVPRLEDWYVTALKLNKKITWKEYWAKFLELGEPVIDQFLVDIFIEIFLSFFYTEDGSEKEIEIIITNNTRR